jgi:hypothetical protein
MSLPVSESGGVKNMTASGNITGTGTGSQSQLIGFYVNSTSSGTLVLTSGGSGGTAMSGTITPAIGFHRFPAIADNPIYATIGGTLNVTFFFAAS